MRFDFRLQGGGKFYAFGLGWLELIGESGFARILSAPDFCHDADCAEYFTGYAEASWFFWRAGDKAWSQLLEKCSLSAPLSISAATLGVGFVSIDDTSKWATVDVCLSVTQTTAEGISIFDDWDRIVKDAKDDLYTEIVLHLNLGAATVRDLAIDGFKSGKRLGTTDLELEVRPSAIQFRPDD
jgi:hypothetical protein